MSQKNIYKAFLLFTLMVVAMGAGCSPATDQQPTDTMPGAMTPSDSSPSGVMTPGEGAMVAPPATEPTPTTPAPTTPPATEPAAVTPPAKSSFKDGTYSADGTYMSPGGQEAIGITITLKNDVVTAVSAVSKTSRPMSQRYQGMFIGGLEEVVVGKKITEVSLTKVSGSSLTPAGFNDAVVKIQAQAKNS